MREIKFLAWHKKRKKMYRVLHLHTEGYGGENMVWATCRGYDIISQDSIHIKIQPDDCILLEFTGERDKDRGEIYEGHVIQDGDGGRYQIKYRNGGFYADGINRHITTKEGRMPYSPWLSVIADSLPHEYQIIGNIYKNPDLLS